MMCEWISVDERLPDVEYRWEREFTRDNDPRDKEDWDVGWEDKENYKWEDGHWQHREGYSKIVVARCKELKPSTWGGEMGYIAVQYDGKRWRDAVTELYNSHLWETTEFTHWMPLPALSVTIFVTIEN